MIIHLIFIFANIGMEQYKIIEQSSIRALQNEVNNNLKKGWKTKGSHKVVIIQEYDQYTGKQHKGIVRKYNYSQTLIKNIT